MLTLLNFESLQQLHSLQGLQGFPSLSPSALGEGLPDLLDLGRLQAMQASIKAESPYSSVGCSPCSSTSLKHEEGNQSLQNASSPTQSVESLADVKMEVKMMRDQNAPRTCDICGGRTNSYHYDVASCNGCRTFFRRTIMIGNTYVCQHGGKCPRELYRSCRACRFDRCIVVGMNLEAIHFPSHVNIDRVAQAVAHRRKEILQGRQSTPFKFDVISYDNLESQEIDSLVRIESKCRSLRELVDPEEHYTQSLRINLDSPLRLHNVEKLQKQGDQSIEKHIFAFNGDVLDYQSMGFGRCWLGIDLFLCVEVFKSLPVFGQLSLEDKELLLSHVALTIVTLSRSFYSVAQESPVIVMPDGTMPMLAQIKTGMETEVFCRVIEPILRVGVSVEEYVLLKAILYCSADIYGLSPQGRQLLEAERERYASILMRLMQRRYGPLAGAKKYADVVSLVDTYFHFGLRFRQHCLMINVALKLPKRYALIEDVLRGGNQN